MLIALWMLTSLVSTSHAGLSSEAEISGTVVDLGSTEVTLFHAGAYVKVPRDLVDEKLDLRPGTELVIKAKPEDMARVRVVKAKVAQPARGAKRHVQDFSP